MEVRREDTGIGEKGREEHGEEKRREVEVLTAEGVWKKKKGR